jgi:hypothetical protein
MNFGCGVAVRQGMMQAVTRLRTLQAAFAKIVAKISSTWKSLPVVIANGPEIAP